MNNNAKEAGGKDGDRKISWGGCQVATFRVGYFYRINRDPIVSGR